MLMVSALVGALVFSAIVRFGSPGKAVRAAIPVPPSVGSCVVRSSTGVQVVGCDEPHSAEVSLSWNADSPSPPPTDPYQTCQTVTASYLRVTQGNGVPALDATGWGITPVPYVVELAHGPQSALVAGWSWQACLVLPVVPKIYQTGYTGRLADLPDSMFTPPNLRPCYLRDSSVRSGIACGTAHLGEILASQQLRLTGFRTEDQDTDPARTAQCTAIARTATGAADPTYGGRLSVVIYLQTIGAGATSAPTDDGLGAEISEAFTVSVASCALEVTGRQRLYGSVVGVGDAALPIR